MAKYLIAASYTGEGLQGLRKDKATGRRQAIATAIEGLGGRLECEYFALGVHVVYLIGVPHRIAGLDAALGYIRSHDRVWFATGEEIVRHWLQSGATF